MGRFRQTSCGRSEKACRSGAELKGQMAICKCRTCSASGAVSVNPLTREGQEDACHELNHSAFCFVRSGYRLQSPEPPRIGLTSARPVSVWELSNQTPPGVTQQ